MLLGYIRDVFVLLGNIRNLAMEKVATSVQFPCKYCSSGCQVTLPHTDKPDHEETCEYRSVTDHVASIASNP